MSVSRISKRIVSEAREEGMADESVLDMIRISEDLARDKERGEKRGAPGELHNERLG